MESSGSEKTSYGDRIRKKRIQRRRSAILVCVFAGLLLPTILCIILFFKVNSLQKQINDLLYKNNTAFNDKSDSVYSFEKNLYYKIEDYASSLEESGKTEYNKEETLPGDTDNSADVSITFSDKTNGVTADNNSNSGNKEFSNKEVYLTFDDGPSIYTEDILKILDKYGVKATFFVIGKTDEHSKRMYKRIVDEGHSLGLHSYSHDYNIIYKSLEDFKKDFTKLRNLVYNATGYMPDIFRFPGGSSNPADSKNISAIINYLNEESVVYFDWNVINGDATGKKLSASESYDNVLEGVKLHSKSIVLMHDTKNKKSTVDSLDKLLKELTENGAQLLPLSDKVTPIQQRKSGQ